MKLTPEQLAQNAAAMLAYKDGKPIQVRGLGLQQWQDLQGETAIPSWDCQRFEYRPKPWSLPDPPVGMEWHRNDWKEEMLPEIDGKQTRPLLKGEFPEEGCCDQYTSENGSGDWYLQTHSSPFPAEHYEDLFHRTTRPVPLNPKTRNWNKPEEIPMSGGEAMTINTKLSVGDYGFFMSDNKVKSEVVTSITIKVEKDGPRDGHPKPQITYELDERFSIPEVKLFPDKESLIASL